MSRARAQGSRARQIAALNNGLDPDLLDLVWKVASKRVAADGAGNTLLDLGLALPDLVHGDLDSLRPEVAAVFGQRGVRVTCDKDQEKETDMGKCMEIMAEWRGARHATVLVLGAFGGRVDQEFANINTALRHGDKFSRVVLMGQGNIAEVLVAGTHRLELGRYEGPTCGLIPVFGRCAAVTTRGLRWDLTHRATGFGDMVSTSNHAESHVLEVTTDRALLWTTTFSVPPQQQQQQPLYREPPAVLHVGNGDSSPSPARPRPSAVSSFPRRPSSSELDSPATPPLSGKLPPLKPAAGDARQQAVPSLKPSPQPDAPQSPVPRAPRASPAPPVAAAMRETPKASPISPPSKSAAGAPKSPPKSPAMPPKQQPATPHTKSAPTHKAAGAAAKTSSGASPKQPSAAAIPKAPSLAAADNNNNNKQPAKDARAWAARKPAVADEGAKVYVHWVPADTTLAELEDKLAFVDVPIARAAGPVTRTNSDKHFFIVTLPTGVDPDAAIKRVANASVTLRAHPLVMTKEAPPPN